MKVLSPIDQSVRPDIVGTEISVSTPHFKIERMHLRFKNGEERTYERMLGARSGPGAVMIVPVHEGSLLLVKEYCAGTHSIEIGFPKGKIDPGEDYLDAANRELREETGFGAGKITKLRDVNSAPSFFSSYMSVVLAEELSVNPLDTGDEPEPLELVRVPLGNARDLLTDPEFREARCLAALAAAMASRPDIFSKT